MAIQQLSMLTDSGEARRDIDISRNKVLEISKMPEGFAECFWSKVDSQEKMTLCWPWRGATNPKGYGNIRVNKVYTHAHRVAWALANFDIPAGYQICHVCDNPACCNPAHLMLGNVRSNFCDMVFKNRMDFKKRKAIGARNTNAKLTDEKVAEIRLAYTNNELNQYELADKYGVKQSTIGSIVRRKTWRHVA